jgi:hypothetical protein
MATASYNTGNDLYDLYGNPNVVADYRFITDLLDNIPDNTANLIDASDVRDAVWTLWSKIDDVIIGLSSSGIDIYGTSSGTFSADITYDRTRTSSAAAVGGVTTGSTFSGTIQDVLDRIFYPYSPPTCSLNGGGTREFGSSTAITLNFTINKNEKPINTASIQLLGSVTQLITPLPSVITQTNTIPATFGPSTLSTTPASIVTYATHSTTPTSTSIVNTYTLNVGDGTSTVNGSTSVTWMNRMYYGTINLSTLPSNSNPDLNIRPDGSNSAAVASSIIQINSFITDSIIRTTTTTSIRPIVNRPLVTTRTLTLTDFDAGSNYLFFAWPTIFGTPVFKINGLTNTSFTKVKSNFVFTNSLGFSGVNYDVWISNTSYGTSTINIS